MATQQDLQELLRLLTGARKLSMMQAMSQVKALQTVNLRRCVRLSLLIDVMLPDLLTRPAVPQHQTNCRSAIRHG